MILTLEVIGEQAEDLGAAGRKVFNAIGGTIGRLPDNDWVFPDPYVSGRHALIRYLNGKYFIEDTSTNGVFINSPDNRLSRTAAAAAARRRPACSSTRTRSRSRSRRIRKPREARRSVRATARAAARAATAPESAAASAAGGRRRSHSRPWSKRPAATARRGSPEGTEWFGSSDMCVRPEAGDARARASRAAATGRRLPVRGAPRVAAAPAPAVRPVPSAPAPRAAPRSSPRTRPHS